jgi:glyoxylase-like metal-dependent hydrolase (beta-lactamase superfamily II)
MLGVRVLLAVAAVTLAGAGTAQPLAGASGLIKETAGQKISAHVTVIADDNAPLVPNVGIVVGTRATLIVDTGLGDRNGRTVLAAARKASGNTEFYVTATHYHPEHDLGATAFPPNAKMLRWREQQKEVDEQGADITKRFAGFSSGIAELLKDAKFRPADLVFDDGITLDLGGVHVRIWGVGPTHTRGDTVFYVEEDKVLFAGDVVMPVFVAANGQYSSVAKWLADLDEFAKLAPTNVIPAHGRMGGVELVTRQREYLAAVQSGAAAAKREGKSAEDAVKQLADSLVAKFPGLAPGGGGPATGRVSAAIQAAYREAK